MRGTFLSLLSLLLILSFFYPSLGKAQLFYLDAGASGGFTQPSVQGDLPPPKLLQWGVQGDLGLFVNSMLVVGLGSEYRSIQQLSKYNPHIGNYSGKFISPIYPFLGLDLDALIFKVDLKTLGNYELANKKIDGTTVIFKGPLGARFNLLFYMRPNIYWGIFYEKLTFHEEYQKGNDFEEKRELIQGQTFNQFGLTLTFVFRAFKQKEDIIRTRYSSPYD